MHPDIKKFWEDSGHNISVYVIGDERLWIARKNGELSGGHIIYHHTGSDEYYWDHSWYNEEEMLRIVKLKAFL